MESKNHMEQFFLVFENNILNVIHESFKATDGLETHYNESKTSSMRGSCGKNGVGETRILRVRKREETREYHY